MKVRCINNTGKSLIQFEKSEILDNNLFGRFGTSECSEFNELSIGKEYLVMGIIVFDSYQAYLVDDGGLISACPCQLFEEVDSKVSSNWHFRLIEKDEEIYPYVQAIFGYYELCFEKKAYENLIIEREEGTTFTYFSRKVELEKE